jgi:hypothetical protein
LLRPVNDASTRYPLRTKQSLLKELFKARVLYQTFIILVPSNIDCVFLLTKMWPRDYKIDNYIPPLPPPPYPEGLVPKVRNTRVKGFLFKKETFSSYFLVGIVGIKGEVQVF